MLQRRLMICFMFFAWMVGVNHCAFESFLKPANNFNVNCPSHESNESHKEGHPCTASSVGLQVATVKAPLVDTAALLPVFFRLVEVAELSPSIPPFKTDYPPLQSLSESFISLTNASNAPPYSA